MDNQSLFSKILFKLGLAIVAIALVDLVYINYWVLKQNQRGGEAESQNENRKITDVSPTPAISGTSSPTPTATAAPAPTSPPSTIVKEKTVVETQTVVQTAQKEIFIPIGSGSTNSNSYAVLSGAQVMIDTTKYSAIDSVKFEANIWVEGGNGRAYAELLNVTDNNPMIESLISSPKGVGDFQSSGNVPIPSGSKTYGIVAKTDLVNFAAHVDGARIKITLK